ncbi:hypothetical protein Pmani_000009 [Petrolisthes manimaculis]|uniref:Arrestin C-terminal-like domain-containing protein n=1 Tax=Petrolisthes manimaculis TaxID=1843537 RepID=A0AAE1QMV2_9EUCA|nr:hypothetical protein Pmani_000009 [Petrolisthes manimaculis]
MSVSPAGKITVYLGRRDFVDNANTTEPIDGVVLCDNDYLRGRKIYAQVNVTYRVGREEDEVMGLHFSKELHLLTQEISLGKCPEGKVTEVQERLVNKLGPNASPFFIHLPETTPCSVQLHPGAEGTAKPLGIIYELKVFVAEEPSEKPHRRNSVTLAVRKVQYCPSDRYSRQPSTMANKGFTFSSGKLNMEVSLDKELYYHGEQIQPQVAVTNNSKKTVKNIKCSVVQHIEVTMTNTQFEREVAGFETKEGCPITPQCHFKKLFTILPHVNNKNKFGIALDGKVKDTDANLASSTLMREDENGQQDALGIVVSYSLRVRLYCGAIAGELLTDLPFKLVHPQPAGATQASLAPKAVTTNAKNDAEGLEVEEFSNLRRGMSVDDNL